MAIMTRQQAAELPQARFVSRCNRCDEDGLLWDTTKGGKPWLYGLMFADEQSPTDKIIEAVQRVNAEGETARQGEDVTETRNVKVEVLRQAPHICPMAGPGTELFTAKPDESKEA